MSQNASHAFSSSASRRIRRGERCPQLQIIETPLTTSKAGEVHDEFRVYNWRVLRSGRIVRGDGTSVLVLILLGSLIYYLCARASWQHLRLRDWAEEWERTTGVVVLLLLLYSKTRTILYESIEPLPRLGLQISTTRGLSFPYALFWRNSARERLIFPLSTSRRFIPLSNISTVIINERLTRWSVRFYLAVVLRNGEGVIVLLENMRQDLEVMKEVYHGVREILFDEFDSEAPQTQATETAYDDLGEEVTSLRRRRSKKKRK